MWDGVREHWRPSCAAAAGIRGAASGTAGSHGHFQLVLFALLAISFLQLTLHGGVLEVVAPGSDDLIALVFREDVALVRNDHALEKLLSLFQHRQDCRGRLFLRRESCGLVVAAIYSARLRITSRNMSGALSLGKGYG